MPRNLAVSPGASSLPMNPASLANPRERPAISLSKSPTSPAWRCVDENAYHLAEKEFEYKWKEKQRERGALDHYTVATLNNLIVTKIKLRKFEHAERLCLDTLRDMNPREQRSSYLCVQCNLSACLFLSDRPDEAEQLFEKLLHGTKGATFDPVKGFFEVLAMVRITRRDCLVLRESYDGVQGLIKVNDYATILECGAQRPQPKKMQRLINIFESLTSHEIGSVGRSKLFPRGMGLFLPKLSSVEKQGHTRIDRRNANTDSVALETDRSSQAQSQTPLHTRGKMSSGLNETPQFDASPHKAGRAAPQTSQLNIRSAQDDVQRTTEFPEDNCVGVVIDSDDNVKKFATGQWVDQASLHAEASDPAFGLTHRTDGSGYTARTDRSSVSLTPDKTQPKSSKR